MLPTFFNLYRMNLMACATPCAKCTCESAPCGPLDRDDQTVFEADASALATETKKWFESPSNFFQIECALNPSSTHCKIFED